MEIGAAEYYEAGLERFKQARDLYRQDSKDDRSVNHHALAYYAAGLAVECLLRAFTTRVSREFEGRHNLERLFQQSGILDLDASSLQLSRFSAGELGEAKRDFGGAVGHVNRVWNNTFRYASSARIRSHLVELGLHHGIKGDILKENLRRLLDSTQRIFDRGIRIWEATTSLPRK
jgi:hypothetical protein